MFRHPAWALGSYSSGRPAAETVGTGTKTNDIGHPVVGRCIRAIHISSNTPTCSPRPAALLAHLGAACLLLVLPAAVVPAPAAAHIGVDVDLAAAISLLASCARKLSL